MVSWPLLSALLFTLAFAGCINDPSDGLVSATASPMDDGASDDALTDVMLQSGCQSFYSTHRVDKSYAEARLPDGLRPYDLAGGAQLTLKSWTCPESVVDDTSVVSGAAIVYYIAVDPQGQYDAPHVEFSWYPLEIVTATEDLAAIFQAWGFTNAAVGDVSITWETDRPRFVTVAAQGTGTVDARLANSVTGLDGSRFTVRYFAGDGERVLAAVDIVVHEGGRGGLGPTVFHLQGEHAPAPTPLPGSSGYQGWNQGQLSYTWTPVSFEG